MNSNYCVCCGAEIPEGQQVCQNCIYKYSNGKEETEKK